MTKNLLKLPSTESFEVTKGEDGDFFISGYASKTNIDRDMEIIPTSAINLENFMKNPIILYQHDRTQPVGKAVAIEKREDGLFIKVLLSKTAETVRTLIDEGILKAFSVGFRIKDYDFLDTGVLLYKDIELMETSLVSVPCHQDALFEMCKNYNETNFKPKEKLIPEPKKMEKTIMTPEEKAAKDLLESINLMKAEKAALEAEKAQKIQDEKDAKYAAEKALMQEGIKTLGETVTALTEKLDGAETAFEEKMTAVETKHAENLEEVKNSTPRIEIKDTDEATQKAFMGEYEKSIMLGQLFKKEPKDTLAFTQLPERAKTISWNATFTKLVKDIMLEDIRNEAIIYRLFREIPSTVTTDELPFNTQLTAGWAASVETSQTWTPGLVTIPYYSVMARCDYNYVVDEEAIITWLPFLKNNITVAIASEIDAQILDTVASPTLTYRGVCGHAIEASYTVAMADEADIVVGDIDNLRAYMGKYGVNPLDLALILNSSKFLQIVDDDLVSTVDKFGSEATIKNGVLAKVRGIDIFQNDNAPGSSSVGITNYAATLVNIKFYLTKMKNFMLEFEKNISSQTMEIVGSARVGFGPATVLSSSDLQHKTAVIGTNPAS